MQTRRDFLCTGLAAGAGLTIVPFATGAQGAAPGIEGYTRPGEGSVNSYLLIGDSSVALVDCQRTLVEARQLLDLVRAQNKPLEGIVITHEHVDHTGGLALFMSAFPDVPVYASSTTRDAIAADKPNLVPVMRRLFGSDFPDDIPLPNRMIEGGSTLELAGRPWRVDQIGPCEAKGMTLLVSEAVSVLVAADLFGNRMTPWLVDGNTRAWVRELEAAKARYDRLRVALPGHGAAAPALELIEAQLAYLQVFQSLVRAEAQGRPTLDDGARRRIRAEIEARYPGYLRVAPPPNLIEMNADAVAREFAAG